MAELEPEDAAAYDPPQEIEPDVSPVVPLMSEEPCSHANSIASQQQNSPTRRMQSLGT